jgi:hypothetical protein
MAVEPTFRLIAIYDSKVSVVLFCDHILLLLLPAMQNGFHRQVFPCPSQMTLPTGWLDDDDYECAPHRSS